MQGKWGGAGKSYRQMHENPAKLTERLISDQHARD